MPLTIPLRVVSFFAALAFSASAARAASLTPLASRSLMLTGGGRIEVGTRYHSPSYRTGEPLRLDPVISTSSEAGGPEVLSGSVELRPHGFAPCLSEADDAPGCVQGTPPTLDPAGTPSTFSFSFLRLFNTTDPDGSASQSWFGYASFVVTLTVRAADGAKETVRFPLTVTVQQSEMTIERPEILWIPRTATLGHRPAIYPISTYPPPLRDRLTSTEPLE